MEAKFTVGDRVDQSPRDRFVGTVKAVYTTREGETRYAVDMEDHGTLRLCSEIASSLTIIKAGVLGGVYSPAGEAPLALEPADWLAVSADQAGSIK